MDTVVLGHAAMNTYSRYARPTHTHTLIRGGAEVGIIEVCVCVWGWQVECDWNPPPPPFFFSNPSSFIAVTDITNDKQLRFVFQEIAFPTMRSTKFESKNQRLQYL